MSCCYPVGASRIGSSPTRLKPSQQVGRELHVQPQQWAYEAGGTEDAGRVIEPRNDYNCGPQDNPQEWLRVKPTVSSNRKAAIPVARWQVAGLSAWAKPRIRHSQLDDREARLVDENFNEHSAVLTGLTLSGGRKHDEYRSASFGRFSARTPAGPD